MILTASIKLCAVFFYSIPSSCLAWHVLMYRPLLASIAVPSYRSSDMSNKLSGVGV